MESVAVTNEFGEFLQFPSVAKTVLHEYFQAATAHFGDARSAAVLVFAASRANTSRTQTRLGVDGDTPYSHSEYVN